MNRFLMASLALLLTLALSSTIGLSNAEVKKEGELPYTFFLTHYELLGDPNNPDGVRYHSNGKPFVKAPDGSKVILTGKGGWNPKTDTAEGGGHYTIRSSSGAAKHRDLGELLTSDRLSNSVVGGGWDRISTRKGGKDHLDRLPSQGF